MSSIIVSWYQGKVFPYLMDKNLDRDGIIKERVHILSYAKGEILEIGIGTGNNLPFYPNNIKKITAVDSYVREIESKTIAVDLKSYSCEKLEFADNTFDTVVSTFCLCSVKDPNIALREIKRVLKPGGRLLILEHGRARKMINQKIQNIANPMYNRFACGCNVNRDFFELLEEEGYIIKKRSYSICKMYPKCIVGYLYKAVAEKEN